MSASATTITTFRITDLEPGADVGLSIDFRWGEHGVHEFRTGTGNNTVDENGVFVYALPTRALTHGHQGTAKVWARPAEAPFGKPEDALLYASGPAAGHPAVFTFHLP